MKVSLSNGQDNKNKQEDIHIDQKRNHEDTHKNKTVNNFGCLDKVG